MARVPELPGSTLGLRGLGLRVTYTIFGGLGLRVLGLRGFGVLGFRVQGLRGLGFRVEGFRV